jgi:DNA-nicking Smr family endonuclease
LVEAASEAETVISSLRKIRQDENVWQELYQDIPKLAEKQNVLPSKPRTAGRQQNRDNVPADTPKEYWRRSVYYPLLDHIAIELETSNHRGSQIGFDSFESAKRPFCGS